MANNKLGSGFMLGTSKVGLKDGLKLGRCHEDGVHLNLRTIFILLM